MLLNFEIRNIQMEDKRDFYRLIDQVNKSDDLGYSITEEWLDHVIKNFSEGIFLVYNKEELLGVGTCMINVAYPNQSTLNIIVHPDYRSLGIGSKLYEALERFAKSKEISLVEIFVKDRLDRSLKFAEKLGFKVNIYSWEMEIDLSHNKLGLENRENLTFREANLDDKLTYKSIIFNGFGDELQENSLVEILKDPSISVYFLEKEDMILGSLTVQKREDMSIAYMYDIVIFKDKRKKGFGSYMIKSSLEILRREGIKAVSLLVTDDNDNALKLYKKIGFKQMDLDFIMVKSI